MRPLAREAATKPPDPLAEVDWARYDFIDLGSSKGGSLEHCRKRFGGRGIGIDLDAAKVRAAREAGLEVVAGDATRLDAEDCVRFVSMRDFLEHLPDLAAVEAALRSAARAATDFLYIKHPSFEGREYLGSLGLGQYWWMWSGHTCHVTVADYHEIFARLRLTDYTIRYQEQVMASDHPSIISTTAPRNMQAHNPETHPPKPYVRFGRPVWRAQEILVALRPLGPAEWSTLSSGSRFWRLRRGHRRR